MSLKSPATKFIGVGVTQKRLPPSKVPPRESEGRATSARIGVREHFVYFIWVCLSLNEWLLLIIFEWQEQKRRQLESILEKENCKERRERVAYVLTQKLVFKFGRWDCSDWSSFFADP